jgi:hypothetical protein
MTDAELFISYNMPAKALAPLLSALAAAPRDLRLNQKLVALHTRSGRFAEAGVCCRTLQSVYHDGGYSEEAARYGDLAAKYEERSRGTPSGVAAAEQNLAGRTATFEEPPTPAASVGFEIAAPQTADPIEEAVNAPPAAEVVEHAKPSVPAQKSGARTGLFFHAPAVPVQAANLSSPPEATTQAAADFSVATRPQGTGEIDLSNEWEQDLTIELPQQGEVPAEMAAPETALPREVADHNEVSPAAAGNPNLGEAMEEVRFYLGQGMTEQADQVLSKLEASAPGSPELAVLRLGVDSAKQSVQQQELEVSVEAPQAVEVAGQTSAPVHEQQPWPQQPPVLQEMVSEIEASLGNNFLAPSPAEAAITEPVAAVASVAGHEFRSGTLDDFVSDLEASLGSDFLPETPAVSSVEVTPVPRAPESIHVEVPSAPITMAAAASATGAVPTMTPSMMPSVPISTPPHADFGTHHPAVNVPSAPTKMESAPGVDLADMFGELKQELEEGGASADEDPETHYNLGVAFREMGLLDEAIGEFQKVCQASEHGHAFSQLMQTYTWLAQCFLDKGVPEAAVRWYERALKLPNLDAETRTALHYELGSSFENAGNLPAALSNFLEVYGNNIDYRDVAERIKALRT